MSDVSTEKKQNKQEDPNSYPTKRGISGNLAKIGFLLLTDILVNMKCIGRENFPKEIPYVVASNHQCFADGVLISKFLPRGHFKHMCALVGADLATDYGALGRLIVRVGRGIGVERHGNPVRGLIKCKKVVEAGNICFVFPEGTRTHDGRLGEMKDGACYIAIKSKSPLVPVYLSGAYDVWPRQSKWPKPFKGFFKRKKIRVYVGEPLYGADYNNDAHLMTDALSKWMHEMESKYLSPN